jgi:hypothetical protein
MTVVKLTLRPVFTPRKIPGTHLWYRLCRAQDHNATGRIGSIEKFYNLIGNRIADLPACSIVHQPSTLPGAPKSYPYVCLSPCSIVSCNADTFVQAELNIQFYPVEPPTFLMNYYEMKWLNEVEISERNWY